MSRRSSRRTVAPAIASALLALLLVGCSGGGTTEAVPDEPTGAPALETMDPGMAMGTVPPGGEPSAVPADDAMNPLGDAELEERLPSSVDGVELTKASFSFANTPLELATQAFAGADSLGTLLEKEGKTWADVSYATAMTPEMYATDPSVRTGMIYAYRVRGASEAAMLDWFGVSGNATGDFTEVQIGGKPVRYYAIPGIETGATYLWADGDTVFWVIGANPKAFGDALVAAVD
ncbi:MAG: hypothetical protein RL338_466 [Chloroflexota bacterium]